MAIEARSVEFLRDTEYSTLKKRKADIETQVQNWVSRATALHSDSSGASSDQTDIIALRDAFVSSLRGILGV